MSYHHYEVRLRKIGKTEGGEVFYSCAYLDEATEQMDALEQGTDIPKGFEAVLVLITMNTIVMKRSATKN